MSFSDRKKKYAEIIGQLDKKYQEASYWLPYSALEIKENFTPEELNNLEKFIEDMENATSENERLKKLSEKIQVYGKTILNVLKLAKIL